METSVRIDARYCGPPQSGNGGYSCGILAEHISTEIVEVTLRLPPPLDTDLLIKQVNEQESSLWDGENLIGEAKAGSLSIEVPDPPSWTDTEAAVTRYAGFKHHVFPTCFVCGPERDTGDGLRIFAGQVSGKKMVAAPWIPDASLADETGNVRKPYIWAALDCPGAYAIGIPQNPIVLGRMTARIDRQIKAGDAYRVIGWTIDIQGRKSWAGTAIFDSEDRLCAVALAIWIELQSAPGPS